MRIVSVVGTRPQLIKAAALQPVLQLDHEEIFVDTGQHYDEAMAGAFFEELGLRRPDYSLGVNGGGHGEQTGRMLQALEPLLRDVAPDAVLVYGDTNSTLAGALAAAKLQIPVAHVEAGLRSFDRRMPEELNRIVADHLATWLFAPTPAAVANLAAEGLADGVTLTGDLMLDLAARVSADVRDPAALARVASRIGIDLSPGCYLFATVHRAENRELPAMETWAAMFGRLAAPDRPIVLALHPGTKAALDEAGIVLPATVRVVVPQGYRSSLTLQLNRDAAGKAAEACRSPRSWRDLLQSVRFRVPTRVP